MANKREELLEIINLPDAPQSEDISQDSYADDEIGPGKCVTLNFSLTLAADSKALIDSNFAKAPVSFEIGDSNLLPGFERALFGLKAGADKEFKVFAKDAFGLRNDDNIQRYPRYHFPADLLMEKGLMINFTDAAGNEQAGIIDDFDADNVSVDFNHPLAGRDILFKVAIREVTVIIK